MGPPTPKEQWRMTVSVWHSPSFGHDILMDTRTIGREAKDVGRWVWKGLGMPEEILLDSQARLVAMYAEHLLTRYGVMGELPNRWAGEPDPF